MERVIGTYAGEERVENVLPLLLLGGGMTLLIIVGSWMYMNSGKDKHKNRSHAPEETGKRKKRGGAVRVLYGTTTGTARTFASTMLEDIKSFSANVDVVDLKEYDQDNLELEDVVIIIMSTWTGGKPPKSAEVFCAWLEDTAKDFRVGGSFLNSLRFCIFGLGNSEYDDNFCKAAKVMQSHLEALGAKCIHALGTGDDMEDQQRAFDVWRGELLRVGGPLQDLRTRRSKNNRTRARRETESQTKREWVSRRELRRRKRREREAKGEAAAKSDAKSLADDPEDILNAKLLAEADADLESDSDDDNDESSKSSPDVMDVEDLSNVMAAASAKTAGAETKSLERRTMVTPKQRKALTKEGYKIIGTHSAVKLCRWTKHQLRGRGGCYKHTCYGITSYQCMEATPSLACANKCVFCWRHHKNPVGREWRWKEDEPCDIVDTAIQKHRQMIKEFRGVKGVKPERWREAMTVRHCALSLVGEPIMYPRINEMLKLLHQQRISTFLVTNAQFPDRIKQLDPVTQLYVSIDAATPESLKAVDRPLFKDFWQRFLDSLRALKAKRQRTVYRLTLVKGWNMAQIRDYAKLVMIGEPDFIEIKAVTYCGKSDGSSLTMKNVPWYEEVCKFSEALLDVLGGEKSGYGIASAHRHSCLVLLAKSRFKVEGRWHSWINYETFDRLIKRYYASGGKETFTATDYMAPTPTWALYGAKEEGFDPKETRFRKTRNGGLKERKYKASSSGCG